MRATTAAGGARGDRWGRDLRSTSLQRYWAGASITLTEPAQRLRGQQLAAPPPIPATAPRPPNLPRGHPRYRSISLCLPTKPQRTVSRRDSLETFSPPPNNSPICFQCETRGLTIAATEVDHIVPIVGGPCRPPTSNNSVRPATTRRHASNRGESKYPQAAARTPGASGNFWCREIKRCEDGSRNRVY